jgi:hypothetical protein
MAGSRRNNIVPEESLLAFNALCALLASNHDIVESIEECDRSRRRARLRRRFSLEKLLAASDKQKNEIDRFLIRTYRRKTGVKGKIDIDKLIAWCKDHWFVLLLAKVSLLLLFCF